MKVDLANWHQQATQGSFLTHSPAPVSTRNSCSITSHCIVKMGPTRIAHGIPPTHNLPENVSNQSPRIRSKLWWGVLACSRMPSARTSFVACHHKQSPD